MELPISQNETVIFVKIMFSFIAETAVRRLLTCGVHQPQYASSLFRGVLGCVCVKDPFLIHFLWRYQILALFEDAT